MNEPVKRFGKPTNISLDAAKLADEILNRGNHEEPAANLPPVNVAVEPKVKPKKKGEGEAELNLKDIEITIPISIRLPIALQQFIVKLSANETLLRNRRVNATQIYVAAITEYAVKNGFKG